MILHLCSRLLVAFRDERLVAMTKSGNKIGILLSVSRHGNQWRSSYTGKEVVELRDMSPESITDNLKAGIQ